MRKVFTLFILMLIAFSSAESAKTYGWKRLLPHATFDVAVNPYNFNTIYVGGYSRAIYKSTDGGDTWATKYMVSPAARAKINNMLCSHLDTNVIIAGGIQVGDLFKSANSGEDWKVVSKNIPNVYLNGKALFEDSENPGHFYFGNDRNVSFGSVLYYFAGFFLRVKSSVCFFAAANVHVLARIGCPPVFPAFVGSPRSHAGEQRIFLYF